MYPPQPTPIVRITHVDNIPLLLQRQGLLSAKRALENKLFYKAIHDTLIQDKRSTKNISCGPGGTLIEYVPFYFGHLSPMLYRIHKNTVEGYSEGQKNIVYLVATVQRVKEKGLGHIFSDGHGLKSYTKWYDDIQHLDKVDWSIVYQKRWADTDDDNDRMRKKQAEFLVYEFFPWELIEEVIVIDEETKIKVRKFFREFSEELHRPVIVNPSWYY